MSVTVYGASDNLIEVEGDIREEFTLSYVEDDDAMVLGLSNGTLIRIRYTSEGVWRITPIIGNVTIEQASEGDEGNYSDRAYVMTPTPVEWVVCGGQYAHRPDGA